MLELWSGYWWWGLLADSSSASYRGRTCLHWLGLIATGFVCDVDGVNFDYVDIEIPLILIELRLALGSSLTTRLRQCADFASTKNRVPSDSYVL